MDRDEQERMGKNQLLLLLILIISVLIGVVIYALYCDTNPIETVEEKHTYSFPSLDLESIKGQMELMDSFRDCLETQSEANNALLNENRKLKEEVNNLKEEKNRLIKEKNNLIIELEEVSSIIDELNNAVL